MRLPRSLPALISLALAGLACTISLGGPPIPADSAAPSLEALESFKQKWLDLPEMLTNGHFTLTFTEAEVASVVSAAIAEANAAPDVDIPLQNTHVALEDDIMLYAQTNSRLFTASGMVAVHPSISSDGQLVVQVRSSEFGRASLDDPLLEQIAAAVSDGLTSPLDSLPVEVMLTGVSVVDEQLVLTGSIVE